METLAIISVRGLVRVVKTTEKLQPYAVMMSLAPDPETGPEPARIVVAKCATEDQAVRFAKSLDVTTDGARVIRQCAEGGDE